MAIKEGASFRVKGDSPGHEDNKYKRSKGVKKGKGRIQFSGQPRTLSLVPATLMDVSLLSSSFHFLYNNKDLRGKLAGGLPSRSIEFATPFE